MPVANTRGKKSGKMILKIRQILSREPGIEKILLFGSRARKGADKDSDFDLLVVIRAGKERRSESVRLRDLLRPLDIAVDLIVISEKDLEKWKGVPGNLIFEAVREGRLIYDRAA